MTNHDARLNNTERAGHLDLFNHKQLIVNKSHSAGTAGVHGLYLCLVLTCNYSVVGLCATFSTGVSLFCSAGLNTDDFLQCCVSFKAGVGL